jgi:hypothetical protein
LYKIFIELYILVKIQSIIHPKSKKDDKKEWWSGCGAMIWDIA